MGAGGLINLHAMPGMQGIPSGFPGFMGPGGQVRQKSPASPIKEPYAAIKRDLLRCLLPSQMEGGGHAMQGQQVHPMWLI